jgi:hypothetical protein
MVVRCTGACLGPARGYRPRQVLAPRVLLCVIYRKDASMSHEYQCNAWGVKSDMMHTCAQITHTNLY